MKKKILAFSILAGLTLGSCESLVEVEPKNQLSPGVALSDVDGYQAVLTSAYDRLQTFSYWGRDMALLGEAMSDNIFSNTTLAGGRYVNNNQNIRGAHFGIWYTAYTTINELNTIIVGIDGLTVPESQAATKSQVKAEALALRAMVYFDLARVYGYEPTQVATAGAGFDRSVVLRLTPTLTPEDASFTARASVTEVYTQIEKDFKESIPLFTGTALKTRMNKGAAHAFLGKVYLYWGKYRESVIEFDNAINANTTATGTTKIATLSPNIVTAFRASPNPESFFELNFVASTEMAGVTGSNESLFSYTSPNSTATPFNPALSTFGGQLPSAELLALFEPTDIRRNFFYVVGTNTWSSKYSSALGNYTDAVKLIRFSDVLLMKAEALAMQGMFTEAAALVTQLRNTRIPTATVLVPTNNSLIEFIRMERRRELFFEGHRWFDLKRYGQGITKPAALGGDLAPTDFRILAPIPASEVQLNSGLIQNPNY